MKFLSVMMIAVCLVSTTALFSQQFTQQGQKKPCACKDCKCTAQSHCGCYSDKGCNCKSDGVSCCGNGNCNAGH